MEGPTPVSALIHAATMVTAGVYMVARLGPLYAVVRDGAARRRGGRHGDGADGRHDRGGADDIKRVLAYSTVSQLGFMFLAAGVGAFGVAVFHLYTHAFFKALLFLGSGSVIHAMSGEQDMRQDGRAAPEDPLDVLDLPRRHAGDRRHPAVAGFYSKDEILASAFGERPHACSSPSALFTALLTAAYMGRLLFLTFFGSFRGSHEAEHHVHESPASMLGPLVILADRLDRRRLRAVPRPEGHRVQLPERRAAGVPRTASTRCTRRAGCRSPPPPPH